MIPKHFIAFQNILTENWHEFCSTAHRTSITSTFLKIVFIKMKKSTTKDYMSNRCAKAN